MSEFLIFMSMLVGIMCAVSQESSFNSPWKKTTIRDYFLIAGLVLFTLGPLRGFSGFQVFMIWTSTSSCIYGLAKWPLLWPEVAALVKAKRKVDFVNAFTLLLVTLSMTILSYHLNT